MSTKFFFRGKPQGRVLAVVALTPPFYSMLLPLMIKPVIAGFKQRIGSSSVGFDAEERLQVCNHMLLSRRFLALGSRHQ